MRAPSRFGSDSTPHLRRRPGGAFCIPSSPIIAITGAARRPLIDNRWSVVLTIAVVLAHDVDPRRPAWHDARVEGTRLPPLGTHPLPRRATPAARRSRRHEHAV